ncbi:nucleoside-triphosphatase [Listeria floridensis FSL S10-1187]|uniref:dITP/XTP pyrophosphatase n=1 Tax=Listeria floridensis FSL S10-1187 TaxID=1265817 RepID=A0ABN0RCJ3_9LIST|nr:XTP/dITP diphosphatase [Listeria floridensis]EUJ27406.1 nucleoside-triphosphatase [Listeria floridensis FSL S10-1187]
MRELVIATANKGKAMEYEQILGSHDIKILTLLDFPEIGDIEETGTTFAENAAIKAETVAKLLNKTVLADDSGLVVDALDGAPGVYSARYAGEAHNDAKNNEKLLKELKDIPAEKRTARFHCTLAIATPDGALDYFDGECEGRIAEAPSGTNGFGYDPLFYLPNFGTTMANLTPEQKNKISHRGNAIKELGKNIEKVLAKIDQK